MAPRTPQRITIIVIATTALVVGAFCGAIFTTPVSAFVQYATGALLNPGDVTSSHIRNNEIVNDDVSGSAAIDPSKLKGGTLSRALWFDAGTRLGTSSLLTFSTSTPTLTIAGGISIASSTTIRNVTYTWPAADGVNGQGLQTNGAGTLSWGNPTNGWLTTSLQAGESITAYMPVYLATSTIAQADYVVTTSNNPVSWGTCTPDRRGVGQVFNVPADAMIASTSIVISKVGSPVDNIQATLFSTSGGIPGATTLASSSLSGSLLTTSMATTTFTWPRMYRTVGSTTIAMTLVRSGSCSDTDYYRIQYFDVSGSAAGHYTENSAGTWITNSCCDVPIRVGTKAVLIHQVYQASADRSETSYSTVGIAGNTAVMGGTVNVVTAGVLGGYPVMTPRAPYYLCNNVPAICTSPGTINIRIGTPFTYNSLKIWSQLAE